MRFYLPLSPALLTVFSASRIHCDSLKKRPVSTMSSNPPTKQNVVIVGGGLAGTILAKDLSAKLDHSKFNLVVVESRPYLIWMLGGARMSSTTEPGAMDNYFFKYDKFFPAGKGTVKNAKVEKIVPGSDGASGELQLAGGETLSYRGMATPARDVRNFLTSFRASQPSCSRLDPNGRVPSTSQRPTPTFGNS